MSTPTDDLAVRIADVIYALADRYTELAENERGEIDAAFVDRAVDLFALEARTRIERPELTIARYGTAVEIGAPDHTWQVDLGTDRGRLTVAIVATAGGHSTTFDLDGYPEDAANWVEFHATHG